ncbi:hypothetical protein QTN47_25560 [Danxiaibacter flavus]|uniref:Uncharacterized protein n=1 Tax=Danxiaibacter flavus TaxID=3049108 RepID=A0ABV3ZLY3_9BACT|nr:hypothetical protein QNM32_25560 [Chitinophagaceae bacterium DXS]
MNESIPAGVADLLAVTNYGPAISLIIPFNPKMSNKGDIAHQLKCATDEIEKKLWRDHPHQVAMLVGGKLKKLLSDLNYSTHKKSVAVYVSPVFDKVFYLDMEVEPTVNVGDEFAILDLLRSRKILQQYLVLVLGGKHSCIFAGNEGRLRKLVTDAPETVYAYVNELPEKISNFSDPHKRKEEVMEKFLRHMDNSLELILHTDPQPVFVLGNERMAGHFKTLTKNKSAIIDYIFGNYEHASAESILTAITPYLASWEKVRQTSVLRRVEQAADSMHLSSGMGEVWKQARLHRGKLLILEKDFDYSGAGGGLYYGFPLIKNTFDDTVQKVLESGGEIDFVEPEALKKYDHIAMIQHY